MDPHTWSVPPISVTTRYRVVLISRSPDLGTVLSRLLIRYGHEVSAAFDGQTGLRLVLKSQPDVVISCMDLPCLDGFQVASKIRDRLRRKPVIIGHTSYCRSAIGQKAKESGFDLLLAKPASVDQLLKGLAFLECPEECAEWFL
jgi:CheY-like chemotaxis protein